jgi:hypothetical protein
MHRLQYSYHHLSCRCSTANSTYLKRKLSCQTVKQAQCAIRRNSPLALGFRLG